MAYDIESLQRAFRGETQESQKHSQPTLLLGEQVARRAEVWLPHYAQQISNKLAEHPNLMRQFEADDLVARMEAGHFVLMTDDNPYMPQLLACAQVWKDEEGVAEVGTWLKFRSRTQRPETPQERLTDAQMVMMAGSRLGLAMEDIHKVIAIVKASNKPAQASVEAIGGEMIGMRPSKFVRNETGEFAMMHVYDVTHIGERHLTSQTGDHQAFIL